MSKIYAIDFDGTLCREAFPLIGEHNYRMIAYVKLLQSHGNKLILWTCRNGERLQEAISWCASYGLIFDAVNDNLPETLALYGTILSLIYVVSYEYERRHICLQKIP